MEDEKENIEDTKRKVKMDSSFFKRSGTEFNMAKMTNLVRERTLDSQEFYKRLACLPMRIRQMTFINGETAVDRDKIDFKMHQKKFSHALNEADDSINQDIAMQVDSWMRKRTASNSHNFVTKSISSSSSIDNVRRRRHKRHRLREADDITDSGSTTGVESIISGSTEKSASSKLPLTSKKRVQGTNIPNHEYKYLFSNNSDDVTSVRSANSHGQAYSEIEFQKRYRRVFDLQKHLQFVNTTCLSGQKIVRKGNSLPPMSGRKDPEKELADDLLAISSVKRFNEPPSLQANTNRNRVVSDSKMNKINKSLDISPWLAPGRRTNFEKYNKLPQIAGKIHPSFKAIELRKFSDFQCGLKDMVYEKSNDISLDESSLFENDVGGPNVSPELGNSSTPDMCNSSGPICDTSNKTSFLPSENKNSAIDGDADKASDISECEPTPGMKISIHIKYKNDQSLEQLQETGQMKVHVKHRLDGRIHGNNTQVLITESELKHVSE